MPIERVAPGINTALGKAAPAVRGSQAAAGALFAGQGVKEVAKNARSAFQGNPNALEQMLLGASAAGLGGAGPGDLARAAHVPLRTLSGEVGRGLRSVADEILPPNVRVTASNHDNIALNLEQARQRMISPAFDQFIEFGERTAPEFASKHKRTQKSLGIYENQAEPSATFELRSDKIAADAYGSHLGKTYNQNAILRFRPTRKGPDVEHTISGLEDPGAAMELLSKQHRIKGGRIQDGKLIVVDRNNAHAAEIQKAVEQLGARDHLKSGEAKFITLEKYQSKLQEFRERKTGRR
jgi:hypothetical protein